MQLEKEVLIMNTQGGYECEFIEKPQTAFQSECPTCLLVLREPYQVDCCGYVFCRVCIEKVKTDNNPCPCCNAKDFDTFEDKRLKRSLYEFKVLCSNKEQGCQWEGELGQLDNHLNYNSSEEKQLKGCQYSQIKCLHCSEHFPRSKIEVHQSDQCQKRPFSCEYCNDYDSYYEDVTTNHWPVCECYSLECPQKCGQALQRQHLKNHISNDCPLFVIDCDFQQIGCEVRLPRKDMPAHLVDSVVCHQSLQVLKFKEVEGNVKRLEEEKLEIKQKMVKLEEVNNDLSLQVVKLTEHLKIFKCPVEFTLTNYAKQKIWNIQWRSPPFYNDLKGYKLCLGVYPNGYGVFKNKCVTIKLVLMKGEFDDQLEWPLTGKFCVQLLNQDQDEGHMVAWVSFSGSEGNRVTRGEESTDGNFYFLQLHSNLKPNYLQNDCLKFRILFLGT